MLQQYYLPLFDPESSTVVVVAPQDEAEQLEQLENNLMAVGFKISHHEVVESVSDDSSLDGSDDSDLDDLF